MVKKLILLVYTLSIVTQPIQAMDWFRTQKIDPSTVAVAALGILGLGGLTLYVLKAQAQQKREAQEKSIKEREAALFDALTKASTFNPTDLAFLERVLKKDPAAINRRDMNGSLPIINATQASNKALIGFLLKHGAKVNGRDMQDTTALMKAAEKGDYPIASFLLQNGAYVNPRNSAGKTALDLARDKQHHALAKLLDNQQYLIEQQFVEAARTGDRTKLQQLLPQVNINVRDSKGSTALLEAAKHNHKDIVKFLLEHGAQSDIKNVYQVSGLIPDDIVKLLNEAQEKYNKLLFEYVSTGDIPHLQEILSRVDVNTRDAQDNTPLFPAIKNNQQEMIIFLLQQGAERDVLNKKRESILFPAIYSKKPGTLQFILRLSDQDINLQNSEGNTPLMIAAAINNADMIKILLAAGADPNIKNKYGYTARDIAKDPAIVKLISAVTYF